MDLPKAFADLLVLGPGGDVTGGRARVQMNNEAVPFSGLRGGREGGVTSGKSFGWEEGRGERGREGGREGGWRTWNLRTLSM